MKHTNSGKAFTGREFDDLTTAQQKEACLQARNSFQKYLIFFKLAQFPYHQWLSYFIFDI